jgi:hypothetical protein
MLQKLDEQFSWLPPDAGGMVSYSSLTLFPFAGHRQQPKIKHHAGVQVAAH